MTPRVHTMFVHVPCAPLSSIIKSLYKKEENLLSLHLAISERKGEIKEST